MKTLKLKEVKKYSQSPLLQSLCFDIPSRQNVIGLLKSTGKGCHWGKVGDALNEGSTRNNPMLLCECNDFVWYNFGCLEGIWGKAHGWKSPLTHCFKCASSPAVRSHPWVQHVPSFGSVACQEAKALVWFAFFDLHEVAFLSHRSRVSLWHSSHCTLGFLSCC